MTVPFKHLDPSTAPNPNMEPFLPADQNTWQNSDRLLPSQPFMRQFFKGDMNYDFDVALARVTTSVLPVLQVHDKFDIQLAPGMNYETLGSDLSTLHFLQLLVKMTGAYLILEVGTYIGVSTMFLAEAAGEWGTVTTIERGAEFAEIAERNFRVNGFYDRGRYPRIILKQGDAVEILSQGPGNYYTLIFLDGAKQDYAKLLPKCLTYLRSGGLLVVDDVFCQGDTLNLEPTTDKGRGVRALLEQVKTLGPAYSPVILPYGDGLLLLRKPA